MTMADLPDVSSPNVGLAHPTKEEMKQTWTLNAENWGSALSLEDYLEREEYLTTIPATRDGGVTHWILTDITLPPNARPLLSSCESLRRPAIVCLPLSSSQTSPSSDSQTTTKQTITHGIGSVFCPPSHRGRGYPKYMLHLVGLTLKTHQKNVGECYFSILYSDIGKKFYTGLGWGVFHSSHIFLPPASDTETNGTNGHRESLAREICNSDIPAICSLDCENIKSLVQHKAKETSKPTVSLLPTTQTIQWHHLREAFMTSKLLPSRPTPTIHGAISSGPVGQRVWILFTRAFYGPLDNPKSGNMLYILRLVVEDESPTDETAKKLEAVLQIAKREAKEWGLNGVAAWNVNHNVKELLRKAGVQHEEVDREEDSICQLRWYGEEKSNMESLEWVANEKFGWC
ncbi:putative lysine acetyltransferase [Tricladium varicosporioides]|nr:putative lysine acetyltransferase [Hymenoscyphus varicosporioides]